MSWKRGFCVAIRFLFIWIPVGTNHNQRFNAMLNLHIYSPSDSSQVCCVKPVLSIIYIFYICNFMNVRGQCNASNDFIIILTRNNVAYSALCWIQFYRHGFVSVLLGELREKRKKLRIYAVCRQVHNVFIWNNPNEKFTGTRIFFSCCFTFIITNDSILKNA